MSECVSVECATPNLEFRMYNKYAYRLASRAAKSTRSILLSLGVGGPVADVPDTWPNLCAAPFGLVL